MISLCVPTMNRSEFLTRLLHYYASTRFPYWICIGASSSREQVTNNQRIVAAFQNQLNIHYEECPGLSSCAALEQLSRSISTPYCAFLGDDDFICPAGIERCVAFLEQHPECGAVHGKGLMFQTEQNHPYGSIGTVRYCPQAVLTADSGAARLIELFTVSQYALLNSVHRTLTWQAMFRGLSAMPGIQNRNIFKDELIATCVSVIRGTVREIDGLYFVRHIHVEDSYRFPHAYDWLTDPDWFPSYQVFHARLTEELIRQDGISVEQARVVIRQSFWPYVAGAVMASWRADSRASAPQAPSRLRDVAKRVPGIGPAWRTLRAMVQRSRDACSLPALLHASSPYHEDFLPVYAVITSTPRERFEDLSTEGRAANATAAYAGAATG